jgi:hypothetical protein
MSNYPKESFSHNSIDIASHNRVNMKANLAEASGPGVTLAVSWLILVFTGIIIYLALTHPGLLDLLLVILVIGASALAVYAGLNQAVRMTARTIAIVSFHRAQPLRNNLIESRQVTVLYDPESAYRVETARDIQETHHIAEHTGTSPAGQPAESVRADPLEQLLHKKLDNGGGHHGTAYR